MKAKTKPRRAGFQAGVVVLGVVCALLSFALSIASEDLILRRNQDELRVAAPRLHFLTGRPLERLHNGISVPFDFQLSIAAGSRTNVVERALDRFVVSYDLWEEKFLVVRPRNPGKSSPRLSANAAESWCLGNLAVPIFKLPAEQTLWARLEIRGADAKPGSPLDDSGISLTSLIEIFSRPTRAQQDHWAVESGPFRLADLK